MNSNNNNRRNNGQFHQTNGQHPRQPQQPNVQYPYRQNIPQGRTPYPPVRHRSRRQARRAAVLTVLSVAILVMLLVTVVIFSARCASNSFLPPSSTTDVPQTSGSSAMDSGDYTETTEPETTAPETDLAATYEYVEKTEADIHKGYQILVNYEHEYMFENDFLIKSVYTYKNLSYKVRDTLVSLDKYVITQFNKMMEAMAADLGNNFILVNSAHRTLEEQESIFAAYLDKYGEEYAQLYVAAPGHSEHHTGLAADLTVFTDEGAAFKFDDKPEYPEWLVSNGYKYGFVQRYSADKTEITLIAYENWHYRYIGKPHAYYVVKNNLCLEEYIELLRSYQFGENHLQITDDEGAAWEVYFVPADPSGVTKVPVPKYAEYEISGNNVDGFIVTCGG